MTPFHLAFPIRDKEETRRFYGEVLGCAVGREAATWIDFDFFGHQLSAHVRPEAVDNGGFGQVDGKPVPLRHFGVVLPWAQWEALAERLRAAGATFPLEPQVRFAGQPGEQGTFFVLDPAGNALEFKTYRHPDGMFEH